MIAVLAGHQSGMWTALPAIVQSFDQSVGTLTAQPSIQAKVTDKTGAAKWVNLPVLVDVPVCWQGGGGYTLTFPIAAGDECLIVFASRCIDAWWQSGGVQPQAELRMHDLSDGFAFVGTRSRARKLASISSAGVTLRNDTDTVHIELAGTAVNIVAPGGINLIGPVTMTGTVTNNGKNIGSTHTHTGVTPGGGTTGTPS